ncbi:translation initiation factor IF-3 [Candidatus Woesebacteria bacterium]|nr:translation initiation factor IF-3 [Candidatus Woesebacteria bacterium]
MRHKPGKRYQSQTVFVVANHRIRTPNVRVIDDQGKMVGVMPTQQAMTQAFALEKDLVLVNENQQPPIAKIIELNKFKYQQQQKLAASRKKAKAQEIKEVRFSPFMSEGDFESKLKKVNDFIDGGDKVKLSLFFKGRQITKRSFGENVIARVIEATAEEAVVEIEPKMIGKKLIAQLMPKKK